MISSTTMWSRPSIPICGCCRAARFRRTPPTSCRPAESARSSPKRPKRFDLVIIDGPPTLGLADAPLLAAAAGNVLFVVESGRTRTRAAIEALNRLEATGTHILGATLTKSSTTAAGYGYGRTVWLRLRLRLWKGQGQVKRTEILMIPGTADDLPEDRTRLRKGPMPESPRRYRTAVMARRVLVSLVALLLAATVVRNSAVNALADLDPALASAFWSRHPAPEINLAMIEIARAARVRAAAPPEAFWRILDAAQKAPLAPEPFLVDGVRDRSRAARCGPSRHSWPPNGAIRVRCRRIIFSPSIFSGLATPGALLRKSQASPTFRPEGSAAHAPYLAAFARDRANWPRMRALFRINPRIEDAALMRAFARCCECAGNPRTGLARSAQARQSVVVGPAQQSGRGRRLCKSAGDLGFDVGD